MIFEILVVSADRGELILAEGGLCHWHLRRDGQVTIREILVLPERRGRGVGTEMIERLKHVPGATSLFAKCPGGLPANDWYRRRGFTHEGAELTRTGRKVELWRLSL